MRSLVLGAMLAAASLAACGSPPGVLFHTTLSNPNGEYPLPVALGDRTGLVVGIGPAQFDSVDFQDAGILADPTRRQAFIVTWLGGACANDGAFAFLPTDAGYDLQVAVREKLGLGGCPALGIMRAIQTRPQWPSA